MDYTLITGATGYLGRAFARECLRRGENLYLTGRSIEQLSALKDALLAESPSAAIRIFACDLSDEHSRTTLFRDAEELTFSRLINVAGADIQKAFCLYDQSKLTFQIRANFEGAASMCLFCIEHRAEELKIINISSICGEYDIPYFAVYSAAKGALTSFSLSVGCEYSKRGITVTAVLPGAIHTRPDVEEYIKEQGLWGKIAAKSPEYIVKKSLAAAEKGKDIIIPGVANKAVYFLSHFIPRRLKIKFNAGKRQNTSKDAF